MDFKEFQTIEFKWNSKWYHFIYYWFYNRWQKYIKKSNKWIGCCRGDASRPLKTKYTVEFVSDITKNQVCEIDNQLVDNLAIDLQKSIDDAIKDRLNITDNCKNLKIKMPYSMTDDYNIELEIGDYIVKDKNGEFFIDSWVDNIMGFYCWELDALSEIVCKLPSCEELLKILEKEYAE